MDNLKEGLVVKAIAGFFYILYDEEILECKSSSKLKKDKAKIIPGDFVKFDLDDMYIKEVKPRSNSLIRPQLANVSNAILVFSLKEPKMNFGLLDRMLMIMEYNNLKSTILLTKKDLLTEEEFLILKNKISYYEKIGYDIIYNDEINNKEKLLNYLQEDQKYVLTGQSGVGKSTYLNMIIKDLNIKTQEISHVLGRGKHTTRESTFYSLENNIFLIDTPGFSSLDLQLTKEEIRDNFVDFVALSTECRFNGCYHINEPNCNVKENLQNGNILKSRYDNYYKMQEER